MSLLPPPCAAARSRHGHRHALESVIAFCCAVRSHLMNDRQPIHAGVTWSRESRVQVAGLLSLRTVADQPEHHLSENDEDKGQRDLVVPAQVPAHVATARSQESILIPA